MAAPFIPTVPVIATNRSHQTNSVGYRCHQTNSYGFANQSLHHTHSAGYRNQSLPPNQQCRLSIPIAATKQTVSAIHTNR
ncbi:hypothetical protein PoB_006275800 [Plakobranchus ocellatus]|uniref:Uncharacterized protein n=1 Tax=Plakobranchus ocellatus TaxID=259542 RepID=A0AAV4CWK6_9GAST|nr:hypothetical protein PoB_006275800 [Plakobranchus ocellatus]